MAQKNNNLPSDFFGKNEDDSSDFFGDFFAAFFLAFFSLKGVFTTEVAECPFASFCVIVGEGVLFALSILSRASCWLRLHKFKNIPMTHKL